MTDRNVSTRAERARAQADARRRKEARRRQLTIGGVVLLVVVIVVGAMVAVKLGGGGKKQAPPAAKASSSASGGLSSTVSNSLTSAPIKGVPDDVQKQLPVFPSGAGGPVKGQPPLTKNGKPEVLYIGAEYCPFCAAERWPLVIALERFGDFSGLAPTASSSTDTYPNTSTLTFLHATYTSDYLSFVSYEDRDREGNPLQTVPDDLQALMRKIGDPKGGIPFIDYGNKYFTQGGTYNPQILQGMSHEQIAQAAAQHPDQLPGAAIDATANNMTAILCKLTNGQPANVCTDPAITAIQQKIGS